MIPPLGKMGLRLFTGKHLLGILFGLLVAGSAYSQGEIQFYNSSSSITKISTNSVAGGAATGLTSPSAGGYYYALYVSKTATTVSGQTGATVGNNGNYAFNDPNWTFVAYATNIFLPGRFFPSSPDSDGGTIVPGVAAGSTAQFVVIGWSGTIGTNIAAVENWYNNGYPGPASGWIGESAVSGAITLGDDGATIVNPNLFGNAPQISGFVLGSSAPFLYEPAYIATQPTNQTVAVGGTTSFSVLAYGDFELPLFGQWRLNGTNINIGGNYATNINVNYYNYSTYDTFTLTINNAQMTNAGNYSLYVYNSAGGAISSNALLTVNASGTPPTITAQPTPQSVGAGSNATFTVSATASGSLTYQWTFNGTNITNANSASYTLTNVQPVNAGNYAVAISSSLGSTNSSSAALTVLTFAPAIAAQPLAQSVAAGGNVTFSVSATGTASLAYQWTFNGTNIANATSASYTLTNAQPVNAGNYAVTITNSYGATNSVPAALTVLTYPPSIIIPPSNATVQSGYGVTFTVYAGGTAPLSYQWQFHGTNLSGATGTSYSIASVTAGNGGTYSVIVSNAYGTTNATATLTVASQAGEIQFDNTSVSFTKISTNAVDGGAATGFTGTNAGSYYYALYVSKTATTVSGQTGATLGNNGNYAFNDPNWTFVAYGINNNFLPGRLSSSSAIDNYNGYTSVPGVPAGTTAQFVVIGWSGNIGTNIAAVENWYGAGDTITAGWIGESAVSGAITLGDNGATYANSLLFGNAPQLSGFVLGHVSSIYEPPFIATQPTNQTVAYGGTTSFSVLAYGDFELPLFGQWLLNGTNISVGGNYSTNINDVNNGGSHYATFTLNVSNAQATNAGNYSLIVSNAAGIAISSNALLTVTGIPGVPPTIASQPSAQTVGIGSNVTFTVSATGTASLAYQWTFNGTNIANANSASYTLTNVQPVNAGNYAVTITNSYGSTNSVSVALTVLNGFAPSIITPPASATVQSNYSISFSVSAGGTAPLSYQWQFDGTNLAGATSTSYLIANVSPGKAGTYSVIISNAYGTTNAAATLTVIPQSGDVFFANSAASVTKMFTNSAVGGAPTGWTGTNFGGYVYALFVSATATNVSGQANATLGNAGNYAFNDPNWTFVAYGTNTFLPGRFISSFLDSSGNTPVAGFMGGSTAQFVVVGWSANIGTNLASLQSWYGTGNPSFDGWIGESAVSGPIVVGDGIYYPVGFIFGSAPGLLSGFTLGLVQPAANLHPYVVNAPPPPQMSAAISGGMLNFSWSSTASYGVQSANSPTGPWSDTGVTVSVNGTNCTAAIPVTQSMQFFRLIVQ